MAGIQQNFLEDSLIILTKQTLDIFLKQDNPSELIALYTFYYYTAKWQATNVPKCTTDYVAKGLHWNRNKVIKIKKQLLEFGLIEDVRVVDPDTKKVKGYYIKMNYIIKKETLSKSQCTQNPPTGNETEKIEKASVPKIEGVANEDTNALSTNNINALSTNNIKKEKGKQSFDEIIENYTDNEELRKALKEHLKIRKANKALIDTAVEKSLEHLDVIANNDTDKIKIVNNAIMGCWTKFWPLKEPLKETTYTQKQKQKQKEEEELIRSLKIGINL